MRRTDLGEFTTVCTRSGAGAPVLFLHGGFASLASSFRVQDTSSWDTAFSERLEFIVYDRRGCYQATCPSQGYDLESQAHDALALLDLLGIETVHLLASSAGGPIAVTLASLHPARVRSVVFVGSGVDLWRHVPDDPVEDAIRELIDLLDVQGPEASLQARPPAATARLEALYLGAEADETGASREQAAREQDFIDLARQVSPEVRLAYHVAEVRNYRAYMDADDRDRATLVTAPAMVLHGERDQVVPLTWGQELADLLPNSTLQVITGRSHSLLQTSPLARTRTVSFFLEHSP